MRAIVAEIDKKQMLVITEKGDFIKIKRQMSAAIGDEVEFNSRQTYIPYRRLASIAACFLACIFLSTGVYAYYTPYSYVSVDINPSLTMSLNRFERVISVEPLTDDAVTFIKDTKDLKNKQIDKALSEIIKSASEKGYLDVETENQVMVVVSAKDARQEEKLAGEVNKAATRELSNVNKSSEVTVEKISVESYKAALSNKVSPGREILADKLREIDPDIKDEVIEDMSVKEAVKYIKEGRKAAKALEKDNKSTERENEIEEYFQNKKIKDKKNDNKQAEADSEDNKAPVGNGKVKASETSKTGEIKPAGTDKDTKVEKDTKDQEADAEKDKNDNGNKDKDNNESFKVKGNKKFEEKSPNSDDLKQIIKDILKKVKE